MNGIKPASILKWSVQVCTISCVFFLTIEICARIDDKLRFDAPLWGTYSVDQLTERDSGGVQSNVPNAHFEKWHHNSLGFRGVEVTALKPMGTVRVVCMGSSETYGLYESPGSEWPSQLQKLLPMPGWQVINAAMVGIDLRGYQAYITEHVLPLDPDVIIIVVSPYRYAIVSEREQSSKSERAVLSSRSGKHSGTPTLGQLIKGIRFLPKLKQSVKGALAKSFPVYLRKYQERDMERQVANAELLRLKGRKPLDKLKPSCEDSFRNNIRDLVSFLKSKGIRVALTSYPTLLDQTNIDMYREIFLDNRRFSVEYSLSGMLDVRERLNHAMEELAASEGAMFIDLWSKVPRDTKHFGDNVHYTDLGARLIATTLAESLHDDKTKINSLSKPDGNKQR